MAAQERAATSDHATSTPTDHDLIEQRRARASAWCMALAGASLVALVGLGIASLDGIAVTVTANALSAALTVTVMIAFIEHSTGGAIGLLVERQQRSQNSFQRDMKVGLGELAAQVEQLNARLSAGARDADDTHDTGEILVGHSRNAIFWAGYQQCARDRDRETDVKDVIRLPQRNGSSRPTG
jgi:hypothetical protein